jgi:hypothetical protein
MQNETKMEKTLIDEAFYVEHQRWNTWKSFDKDGKPLVTSLTEESCIESSRQFLKWKQEGFPETKTHTGQVAGKL